MGVQDLGFRISSLPRYPNVFPTLDDRGFRFRVQGLRGSRPFGL